LITQDWSPVGSVVTGVVQGVMKKLARRGDPSECAELIVQ